MQPLINGLVSGTVIAVLATAFQVVYLPTRILFLGLAGIYTLAPYVLLEFLRHETGIAIGLSLTITTCAVIGVCLDTFCHSALVVRKASEGAHMIASLGLYMIIAQCVAILWGHETRSLRTGLDSTYRLGQVSISEAQVVEGACAIFLLGVFAVFLQRSDIGLRMRALASNPAQFALLGNNMDRYRLLAFAISGALAACGALLTAYDISFDPSQGFPALLMAIVATMMGGSGSFTGPVFGAILLGVIRAEVVWFGSAKWQDAATFGLLAVVLLVRPDGLI